MCALVPDFFEQTVKLTGCAYLICNIYVLCYYMAITIFNTKVCGQIYISTLLKRQRSICTLKIGVKLSMIFMNTLSDYGKRNNLIQSHLSDIDLGFYHRHCAKYMTSPCFVHWERIGNSE